MASGTFKGQEQKAFASAITLTCLNTGKLERDVSVPVRRTKLFPANASSTRGTYERVSPFAAPPVTCENYQSAGVTARACPRKSAVSAFRLPDHPISRYFLISVISVYQR